MGRVAIGIGPRFLASTHLRDIRQPGAGGKPLERSQPVLVISSAVIWLAPLFRCLEFGSKLRCPFFPGEVALLGELHRESECLRLPGLGEDRTAFIPWKFWKRGDPV